MSSPRILITDTGDRAGLACIRCAAAGGYRVTAAATSRKAAGLLSRRASSRKIIPDPRDGIEPFVEQLSELVRKDRHDVLIPVRDETVYALSTHRERFEPYVAIGLPSHETVERAMDKALLHTEARAVGLAPPEGQVCENIGRALDVARSFGFPMVVKGVRTIDEIDGRSVRYPSRWVVDETALRDVQHEIGTCIVQRREIGDVIQFAGVATEGGLLGSLLTRSHRTWPPEAGNPSFVETITVPRDLAERVEALVAAIGWRGLFQLELIERPDGTLAAIDFNPRPYGSIGLARPAGAPLTTLWCASLLGEDPKPVSARAGVRYRNEEADARHIAWQLGRGDYRGAAAAMLPRRGVAHAFAQARDPGPTLYLGALAARDLGRFARRHASGGRR